MSTLYTCHGKDCPLKAAGPFPIIPPGAVRYKLTLVAEYGLDERQKRGYDLCEVCTERVYGMLDI